MMNHNDKVLIHTTESERRILEKRAANEGVDLLSDTRELSLHIQQWMDQLSKASDYSHGFWGGLQQARDLVDELVKKHERISRYKMI